MANETVICTYRVRPDDEKRFVELLRRHWSTLHDLGFVTDEDPLVFRALDGGPTYVEIFTWVEGGFGRVDFGRMFAMQHYVSVETRSRKA